MRVILSAAETISQKNKEKISKFTQDYG